MLIWILQTGEPLQSDGQDVRPMRAINLSNALVAAGHDVVLWSSDFYHQEKRHRFGENRSIHLSDSFEIRLLKSPGYKRNIGLGRLVDHAFLAYNLRNWLLSENEVPDVAFIGYPPIEAAAILSSWLRQRNVPFLLDVKDQWPSIFIEAIPPSLRILGRALLSPYFYLAKRTMRDASGFSTMSIGFQNWARSFSGKSNVVDSVFPLTTVHSFVDKSDLDSALLWWERKGVVKNKSCKICFIGSLSQAFDFKPIFLAAKKSLESNDDVQYIICGDGEEAAKLHIMFGNLPNVIMPGWVNRSQAVALFIMSTCAIAPYKNIPNFNSNIPNKILDYLSFGLPILCPLKGDVESLLSIHKAGFPPYNHLSLYQQILVIKNDNELIEEMSLNAKNLFDNQFSFEKVYGNLVRHLEKLCSIKR